MLPTINNNLTGFVVESNSKRAEIDKSISKLSSGKKLVNAGDDTGAFSQASKLSSKHKRDLGSLQNLQNLVSYSQSQDAVLEQVGKILNRMNELAVRALDVTTNDEDRENYDKEFKELADQLEELDKQDFNGKKLFGAGAFSADKKQFIESLKTTWLKAAEETVTNEYGWTTKPTDDWNLIVNENDTGGYAAFVSYTYGGNKKGDVIEMQFDLPDFYAPHTSPNSEADRTVAHEMVHLMQAQNNYVGDLTGDGSSRASWFMEGLAEFIHGADSRALGHLGSATPTDAQIDALTAKIGTGNEAWTASDQYSAAYLATRFLHKKITDAGFTDGVKDMTVWMKAQHDANAGSAASGINAYFAHRGIGGAGYDNDAFVAEFKGVNGRNFIKSDILPNINNADTGSIRGSDVGAGPSLDGKAVIDDSITGAPTGTYIEEVEESSLAASIDGTGATYDLTSVNSITISDTATYNLESISNARGTLTQLTAWMETLASERSNVGANLSRLEKEIGNLNGKIMSGEMAVSRIEDTDVAKESTRLSSNQVRMQASIAILAQAKNLNVGIQDLIKGIMIGRA